MSPPLLVLLGLAAALRVPGPLSPRTASYALHARLDAAAAEVHGTATLRWRNPGQAPVRALPVHLYMNAFKNQRSAFMRESRWNVPPVEVERGRWGWSRVEDVRARLDGAEVPARLEPDALEETLATVRLGADVATGHTVEVRFTFRTHLPQLIARAGTDHGFFAVAQWYPKVAAYTCDPTCAFHAAPYHADSEFFADFGVYDVTLDVPAGMVVGATGVRVEDHPEGGRRTLVYHAEDVTDFVWTGDARFVAHEAQVDDGSGLPPVTVRVLGPPSARGNVARHLAAARVGLEELGRRLGPYPYRELTIVQPPPGGDGAAGMEYPTLFFTDDEPAPAALRFPELVTAHELAHQWFQGMIATDEVDEPWLDEGLTEAATGWVLRRLAPRPTVYDAFGHSLGYARLEAAQLYDERADPIATPSAAFRDHRSYALEVYRKTGLLLDTIEAKWGAAPFERALRAYADRGRFRHPRRADLVAAFADAPEPLRALLIDALLRPASLDYAVTAVHTNPDRAPGGVFDVDGGTREDAVGRPAARARSEIVVERMGELRAPIVLRAVFADGTTIDRALPAEGPDEARWRRVELESARPLAWATVHPDADTPLDTRRWNDGLRVEPDRRPRRALVQGLRAVAALLLGWVAR